MRIVEKLDGTRAAISFEFFPPKDQEGVARLFGTVAELAPFAPSYVSVTYGAGGSTRQLTVELVGRIQREVGIDAMAHLTCVGATREELGGVLDQLESAGVGNVIALRGDPPQGASSFVTPEGGFGHASELCAFIKSRGDFCIAGACYPEKHPEAASLEADLEKLKRKVDAGAEFLITQLFFDNADYFSFVERAREVGIHVPIVAGIMPVTNVSQIKRFTAMCGAHMPSALMQRLEVVAADPEAVGQIGVDHAVTQCRELLAAGVPGIHFYTLNRSKATVEILKRLR
ncbi:MAG: 5,10-methylenetetrahydrofolate reductase [Polyangiaceae bacterium]|jgi:methylenetetrahydrofolate reductase (NADPH)|nr:5,10-methylenetetrahydrofolate reductase [Polyangiaceae bacterium]